MSKCTMVSASTLPVCSLHQEVRLTRMSGTGTAVVDPPSHVNVVVRLMLHDATVVLSVPSDSGADVLAPAGAV